MTSRRSVIIGGACLAAAAAGVAAKPRRRVALIGSDQLQDIVPEAFGSWRSREVNDPLALNEEGTLAGRLYNQLLTRIYSQSETGVEIMLLMAYGAEQTNDLQLHRPEVCYPAFGFTLTRNEISAVPLPRGASVPARQLLAVASDRSESVLYWSRMGEFMPLDGPEQRIDRVKIAVQGVIPDGLLARFSMMTPTSSDHGWSVIRQFASDLVMAAPPKKRGALIGAERALALAAVG